MSKNGTHEGNSEEALYLALDEAWTALDEGDLDGAREAGRNAARLAPEHSEVVTLEGAIAAVGGDPEAALIAFSRASALDPDNPTPLIHAAEVSLYSLGMAEDAAEFAARALEIVDDEVELIEAVLIRVEALIATEGDLEEARETLLELESCALDEPVTRIRVASLFLDLSDFDAADRHYRTLLNDEETSSDGHYGIGLVCDARSDKAGMIGAWQQVRQLDLTAPRPEWHLSEDEFQEVAERAMAELPQEVIERLENVPILIEDAPSEELVADGVDPRILGLFSGVPMSEKTTDGGTAGVDTIHLFQRNIERVADSLDELEDEIRTTVLHETAHFFGLDDDDLDEMGLG